MRKSTKKSTNVSWILINWKSMLRFLKDLMLVSAVWAQQKANQGLPGLSKLIMIMVYLDRSITNNHIIYCCLITQLGVIGYPIGVIILNLLKFLSHSVVNSAKLAKQGGCKDFHLVTAQGSNKNSWFLYPKTKGLVEEEVTNMAFNRLSIYRPGLLLCDREV